MIGASSARASRSAHGFLREPHRGVFAPRSPGTFPLACSGVSWMIYLFHLTFSWDLRLLFVTVCLCLSSASRIGFRTGVNSFSYCMLFARQVRFTSSHLSLNLFDSGGLTYVSLCACSRASPRIEPPLLESAW